MGRIWQNSNTSLLAPRRISKFIIDLPLSPTAAMFSYILPLAFVAGTLPGALAECPNYVDYSTQTHAPTSPGKYALSYMRPAPACRTYNLPEVEQTIQDMKATITDPDLFRLFENTFPNTLDTTVSWKGFAKGSSDEEVCRNESWQKALTIP